MNKKITIIGAGRVGSTIAYNLSLGNLASQIVMIDINRQKLEGEVVDIAQGTSFRDSISVIAGTYEDARDSDIVIITSGVARKPGQTRLELAQTNVDILKSITREIVRAAPNAFYILVSNPVDVLTYVFTKISGIPEDHIIGSGTILDTARLRYKLSEHFGAAPENINAYVFGEHGDTAFIPWSSANISSVKADEYCRLMAERGAHLDEADRQNIEEYVHKSGGKIIADKGATYYAVSTCVCCLCKKYFSSTDSIDTVSTMMHGEYGLEDVCLSVLTLMGPNGVRGKIPMQLTDSEMQRLQQSAEKLKGVISQLDLSY